MELVQPALAAELRRLEIKSRRAIDADLMGRYRTAFRGSGLVFRDLRDYEPGDDTRHIHWRATARTGKVYVKSFEEDRQMTVILLVDVSHSTAFGMPVQKHHRALEFSGLLTILANMSHDQIGLSLFSDQIEKYIPPSGNRAQFQRINMALLGHRAERRGTDIGGALRHLMQHQRRPGVVFLISDFLSAPFDQELRRAALRHDVICVNLEHRFDRELPPAGLVEFIDCETGARASIDSGSSRGRAAIHKSHRARMAGLERLAGECGADFISIEDNPLRPLTMLMERRTRRLR